MNTSTLKNMTASALEHCSGVSTDLLADMPRAARAGVRLLQRLEHGTLLLELPDGRTLRLGSGTMPTANLRLHNWKVFSAVARSGDIGLAEGYIAQDWSTPHLAELLKLLIANREALESLVYGAWWGRLAYQLRHLMNRNTRAGSRRNIHAHYDLGNAFYTLWLDPSMNYSSAWFEGNLGGDLTQAQHAKVRRALHSAGVQGAGGCLVTEPAGEFLQLRQFHALVFGKPDRLPEGFVGAGYQFADALLQFFILLRKPVELVLHCFKRIFCHNSTYLVYQEKTAHAGFSGSSIIVSPLLSDANGLSYR